MDAKTISYVYDKEFESYHRSSNGPFSYSGLAVQKAETEYDIPVIAPNPLLHADELMGNSIVEIKEFLVHWECIFKWPCSDHVVGPADYRRYRFMQIPKSFEDQLCAFVSGLAGCKLAPKKIYGRILEPGGYEILAHQEAFSNCLHLVLTVCKGTDDTVDGGCIRWLDPNGQELSSHRPSHNTAICVFADDGGLLTFLELLKHSKCPLYQIVAYFEYPN